MDSGQSGGTEIKDNALTSPEISLCLCDLNNGFIKI